MKRGRDEEDKQTLLQCMQQVSTIENERRRLEQTHKTTMQQAKEIQINCKNELFNFVQQTGKTCVPIVIGENEMFVRLIRKMKRKDVKMSYLQQLMERPPPEKELHEIYEWLTSSSSSSRRSTRKHSQISMIDVYVQWLTNKIFNDHTEEQVNVELTKTRPRAKKDIAQVRIPSTVYQVAERLNETQTYLSQIRQQKQTLTKQRHQVEEPLKNHLAQSSTKRQKVEMSDPLDHHRRKRFEFSSRRSTQKPKLTPKRIETFTTDTIRLVSDQFPELRTPYSLDKMPLLNSKFRRAVWDRLSHNINQFVSENTKIREDVNFRLPRKQTNDH